MIQLPKWTDLRSMLITKEDIDAEIRRLEKLKQDSERETERYLREFERARSAEEGEET